MLLNIDYIPSLDKGIIQSDSLDIIREYFSEADKHAKIKKNFSGGKSYIPKRKYAITEAGKFEIGMLDEIVKYLKMRNLPFKINLSNEFQTRYNTKYPQIPINELVIPLRDYQKDAIEKALAKGCGTILSCTGSGKSLVIASLAYNIRLHDKNTKVLIVTLNHLVEQLSKDFEEYGLNPLEIGKWNGDNKLDTDVPIMIAGMNIITRQSEDLSGEIKKCKIVLKKLKNENKIKDVETIQKQYDNLLKRQANNEIVHKYLSSIGLLIVDEVHSLKKSNELNSFLEYVNTSHRFSLTGTLPEQKIDQWNIIGKIGPIVTDVTREFLVKNKYIAEVDIKVLKLNYKMDSFDYFNIDKKDPNISSLALYEKEMEYIHNHTFRNNIIKKISGKLDKNVLIVVDRLPHGDLLLEILKTIDNKRVFFIKGEMEMVDREAIRKLMEEENDIICIAMSKIFSTGVNIKNLHYILFASSGRAKVKIIQTIGRGVRIMDGKNKVTIFDIYDNLLFSTYQLKRRLELYENENIPYQIKEFTES